MSDYDDYEAQIREGKAIIVDYIQKERADYTRKINAMDWGRSPEDFDAGLYALVLLRGNQRYLIKFHESDLADAPNDIGIRHKLRQQVDKFFQTFLEGVGNAGGPS